MGTLIKKQIQSKHGKTVYRTNARPNRPCLVMLHGLTADHRLFEKQVAAFEQDFKLIVWDCPCHGESRPYAKFKYDYAVRELAKILADEGVEKAVFIGQSLGGIIAQRYIEKHQKQALGFISIDSVRCGDYYTKMDMLWLGQLRWMNHLFPDSMLRNSIAKVCGVTKYTQNSMKQMLASYNKNELCNLIWVGEAAFVQDNHEIKLHCPVALLVGEYDKVGKVKEYNMAWHERSGYPLHIIRHAAHNSNQDNPREVNALIRKYVGQWV